MTVAGRVTRVAADGCIEVEFAAPPRCRGCEGLCAWRRLPATQRVTFVTALEVTVGQPVVARLPERLLLLGVLLIHGLPLAALLGGAIVGVGMTGSDLGAALGAIAAVVALLLATPRLRRRMEQRVLQQLALRPGARADAGAHAL